MSPQQKNEMTLDTRMKALYVMLIRATEMAAVASFQLTALLDALDEKGVINKEEVIQTSRRLGGPSMKAIRDMAFGVESELDSIISSKEDAENQSVPK
jgi:hypothetical protein